MVQAFLSLLLMSVAYPGFAASDSAGKPVPLWGCWEQSFLAASRPSAEVALQVELVSPAGQQHRIDGFWDGELLWKVRFMPDETGEWSFRTRSEPPVSGIHQQAGRFVCRRQSSNNRFLRHGPLSVSADRRRLEHRDGTPFFWLGDTAWNGALLSEPKDWRTYLRDRATKHFSAIQFVATAPWRTAPTDAEGQKAFTGVDPIVIQPRFFQRLDRQFTAILDQGLLPVPVLLWAIRGEENPGYFLPEEQAIRLVKYMVARYGAYPVVWIPAGDAGYSGPIAERWQRIGRTVFGSRPHAPVIMHPGGMQWPWEAFQNESWIDLFGYQSGHGDDLKTLGWIHSGPAAKYWLKDPIRPLLNLEPPYEGHLAYQSKKPHTAYNVRRAAYWSLLAAPIAGLTYGAHGIWSWQTIPGIPLNHQGTGEARPWHEAMRFPGSMNMRHLADFFQSIAWWRLGPAPGLLVEQPGDKDPAAFISAAQSDTGDIRVLYLPLGGEIKLRHDLPLKPIQSFWVDPRTGKRKSADAASAHSYRAPDQQDWLLLLLHPSGR